MIVSDGHWVNPYQSSQADRMLARWREQGVKVILVGVGSEPNPHPSDHVCVINTAEDLASAIGGACEQMLRAA